ncbi:MAG: SLC13 family permease [Myxococcota bacterium]
MTNDATTVVAILAIAAVAFASGRIRLDVTSLLVVLALMFSRVLDPGEALAGFGDPVVLLVAGLIVVGEALSRTGVAFAVGRSIMRIGGASELRLLVLLMVAAGLLGSLMSSTAVVAIFLPVVGTICARNRLAASRLLMPLSFAALASGMLTLVATPTNLIVSGELSARGLEPLGFFDITPVGVAVLVVAVVYMAFIGRRLLPASDPAAGAGAAPSFQAIWDQYELAGSVHRLQVAAGSPVAGRTLAEARFGSRFPVRVVGIERATRGGHWEALASPRADVEIRPGDVLLLVAETQSARALAEADGLEALPISPDQRARWRGELGVAVVLVHPDSALVGRNLRDSGFRSQHDLHVVGVRRAGKLLRDPADQSLASGDALLVLGRWNKIAQLRGATHDFVVMSLPRELDEVAPARSRAPAALAIVAAMIGLCVVDFVPVVAAVLGAALALVASRCLSMEDAYRAMPWASLVLIAGMLPMADALQKTGVLDAVVEALVGAGGEVGPYGMASFLFFLTAGLGLVLSNAATAVLVAPVAIQAAAALEVSPMPFALTVAIAASAAFLTPVSTPVVTLVVAPGGYRFADFLKVGAPLLVLTWLTSLAVIPWLYPF